MNITQYRSYIFDCDGVILDSNEVKTEAFRQLATPFGPAVVKAMVAYHVENGGVSRFDKVRYLLDTLVGRFDPKVYDQLVTKYGDLVRATLFQASETEGVRAFLQSLPQGARCFVVSGGQEDEVKEVLRVKGLDAFFEDAFGSPTAKMQLVERLVSNAQIVPPVLFIGDSITDYEVAKKFGMDFIFLSGYTSLPNWQKTFANKDVRIFRTFREVLELGANP